MSSEPRFRYLPFLDGLRALSIVLVMGAHRMGPVSSALSGRLSGWAGVDVFFVISGFLITSLLVQERAETGSFSFKRFWVRRLVRIAPVYYVYLVCVAVWYGPEIRTVVVVCGSYLSNYTLALDWPFLDRYKSQFQHTWSLCVEEQFYLLWPPVLYLARKRPIVVTVGIILLVTCWRSALSYLGATHDRLYMAFDTRADSILIGCLAAFLWADPLWRKRIEARLSRPWVPQIAAVVLLLALYGLGSARNRTPLFWGVELPLFQALVALLILALVVQPKSLPARALSVAPMVWMGRLSYSIYLWHTMAIYRGRLGVAPRGSFTFVDLRHEAVNYALVFGLACASYYLVERPFLRLKKRWETVRVEAAPAPA